MLDRCCCSRQLAGRCCFCQLSRLSSLAHRFFSRLFFTTQAVPVPPVKMLSRQLVRTSKTAVRQMATAAKDRPLSPHLQIYVPKINMITSVIFRGTGIAMAAGA